MKLEKSCLYKIQNKYGISLPCVKALNGDVETDLTNKIKAVVLKTGDFIYILDLYITKNNGVDGDFYDLKILTKSTICYVFTFENELGTLAMFVKV